MDDQGLTPPELTGNGRAAYQQGDFETAARWYSAAAQAYEEANDPLAGAEMRNNCCVALLQANHPAAALEMVLGTPEFFAARGEIAKQGMALGNIAAAEQAIGNIDQAIDYYRQSAECLLNAGETQLRANTMQALSALLLRKGQQIEALSTMQSGLEAIEKPTLKQRTLKRLLTMPFRLLNRKW